MSQQKRIIFTVTNDLNYDQRMIRIAGSLSAAGYSVLLVGVAKQGAVPLQNSRYAQKRIPVFFEKGFGFYAEYAIRLFFYLLFSKADILCGIDLDTLLPVWLAGKLRGRTLVYDAHEYFSQQNEVLRRPFIYRCWHGLEKRLVPRFPHGYTVSASIAAEFKRVFQVDYAVIRNLPVLRPVGRVEAANERFILYQGAVNEARGLVQLATAMKQVDARLLIYGDGNDMDAVKEALRSNNLADKVLLMGTVLPEELEKITARAYIGINLVENTGLNQYYSLANKFFDYIHAGVPQVSMDFPEYRAINESFDVAVLIGSTDPALIAESINRLLQDGALHERLRLNCLKARAVLNWQEEEKKLVAFYQALR